MSSPSSNLKKPKRSPLLAAGRRDGVPFRQPADCRPSPCSLRAPATTSDDLLASMARRLASVEGELQSHRRELAEKEVYIHRLEDRLRLVGEEDRGQLEARCLALKHQVEEMEEFLNDYGMVWVGGDQHTTNADQVHFDLILKHIQELNALCEHTDITSTSTGATFKSREVVPLTLYQNGLLLFKGPFRPYSHPSTQELLADLCEGYFPSELQSSYPNGVPIECQDLRGTVYTQPSFPGGGEMVGERETLHSFLSRLPASVVRGGKVVDIRASIAHTLQGVEVVNTPALEELRERLERPHTPSHTCTLRVRSFDKTYVLKMRHSDTIASVREHIDRLRGCVALDYTLKSSFPPRTFNDTTQTLLDLGLTPTANLFIS